MDSERDGRAPVVTVHCNLTTDPDVVRFCALTDAGDFEGAAQLCRERLLTARDEAAVRRWTKDRSIVESLRGNHLAAYDLLASIHYLALRSEGTPRGKYETEFGIVHARLGRTSLALERFSVAYQNHRKAGGDFACAQVDTARARALVTRGDTAKALRYLRRALPVAESHGDVLLTAQIFESVAWAFEERGDFEQAFQAAAKSVLILSPTAHETAFTESLGTRARLAQRRGQR